MDALLPYLRPVGYSGVALVVVTWLIVSFSSPGPRRAVFEWLGAVGLYVALLALFINLVNRSLASGNRIGLFAFGFLTALFSIGLVLAVVQTLSSLRGPTKVVSSATN